MHFFIELAELNKKMFKTLFFSIIILIGNSAMAIEEPRFTVITEEKPFEVRVYEPMIIAEVQVSGDRDSATNQGFRLIADYIFGNNEGTNQASEKIAMTAPVTIEKQTKAKLPLSSTQEELADGIWRIQFVMPSEYTLGNLPKPKNHLVKIRQVPSRTYAAYIYSGLNGLEKVSKITQELTAWIDQNHYEAIGSPQLARYNPPWTLPIFRRNEVLIEVKAK